MTVSDKDRDILARTLWAEVRGEGLSGRIAVARTVRNLVEMDLNNEGKPTGRARDIQTCA